MIGTESNEIIKENYKTLIPKIPKFSIYSPPLVKVMDKIRGDFDGDDEFEFYWFAREYPRFYRHHIQHAEYRLRNIYDKYTFIRKELIDSANVSET